MIKLTIAVPTFKRPDTLLRTLESIYNSKNINSKYLEVLLHDNSNNNCNSEIIKKYKNVEKFFYYKHPKNIGPINNLKSLLKKAKGEWIIFLSDDDYIFGEKSLSLLLEDIFTIGTNFNAIQYRYIYKDEVNCKEKVSYFFESVPYIEGINFIQNFSKRYYKEFGFLSTIYRTKNLRKNSAFNIPAPSVDIYELLNICLSGDVYRSNNVLAVYSHHLGGTLNNKEFGPFWWANNFKLHKQFSQRLFKKTNLIKSILISKSLSSFLLVDLINKCIMWESDILELLKVFKKAFLISPKLFVSGINFKFLIKLIIIYPYKTFKRKKILNKFIIFLLEYLNPKLLLKIRSIRYKKDEPEIEIVSILCDKNKLGLDIGANLGIYSYAISKNSKKCIALEPHPDYAKRLKCLRIENIIVLNYAASDKSGDTTLTIPDNKVGLASISQNRFKSDEIISFINLKKIKVKTVLLDEIINDPIDFIKIDTEGHELEVLKGSIKILKKYKPNLLIEIEEKNKSNQCINVFNFLEELKYHCFFLKEDIIFPIKYFNSKKDQLDLLDSQGNPASNKYINNFIIIHSDNMKNIKGKLREKNYHFINED